jgi:hypothetical protein
LADNRASNLVDSSRAVGASGIRLVKNLFWECDHEILEDNKPLAA